MDNARRRRIRKVIKALESRNYDWDDIQAELEDIKADEEEKHDSMPESRWDSDAYMIQEESIDYLEEAIDNIDPDDEDAAKTVRDILEQIDGI